jgi:hypothetical protein
MSVYVLYKFTQLHPSCLRIGAVTRRGSREVLRAARSRPRHATARRGAAGVYRLGVAELFDGRMPSVKAPRFVCETSHGAVDTAHALALDEDAVIGQAVQLCPRDQRSGARRRRRVDHRAPAKRRGGWHEARARQKLRRRATACRVRRTG